MLRKIESKKAPKAIGPYSQAVSVAANQRLIFVSGHLPIDPETGELVASDIRLQTERVLASLEAVLTEAKSSLAHVVRCDVFLKNIQDFAIMNEEYAKKFNGAIPPARQTVEVSALPRGALIEISCIAVGS